MKRVLLATFLLAGTAAVHAQDGEVKQLRSETQRSFNNDTVSLRWKKGGGVGINLNQGSLSNWAAGGDKFSLSLNSAVNLFAFYKEGKSSWDNTLDLAYGIVKTTSLGRRKSNDRIDLLSKYGYAIAPKWNAAILGNFRSQFSNGYNYLKNAAGADSAVLTSKGFAPAYLLLSPGFDWRPSESFSWFISPITGRWTFVKPLILRPIYSLDAGKGVRSELGAFSTLNFAKAFGGNLSFKSRLDLFSNYKHNPSNIDVYWTNALTAKVSKYINVALNFDMIYDDDIRNVDPKKGPAPQLLQTLGIGFGYNFANYKK